MKYYVDSFLDFGLPKRKPVSAEGYKRWWSHNIELVDKENGIICCYDNVAEASAQLAYASLSARLRTRDSTKLDWDLEIALDEANRLRDAMYGDPRAAKTF